MTPPTDSRTLRPAAAKACSRAGENPAEHNRGLLQEERQIRHTGFCFPRRCALDQMDFMKDERDCEATGPKACELTKTISLKVDNILEFINANPSVAAQSKDDAKCKVLFAALGILDLFPSAETPSLAVLEFPGHASHWIIGMRWSGYSEPDGNGYGVFCVPKMLVPAEGVKDVVQYVHERYGGHDLKAGIIHVPLDQPTND